MPVFCMIEAGLACHLILSASFSVNSFPFPVVQATRAYLHAEEAVERSLQAAGFKVVKREMTATQFYFSRLLEAVRA